MCTAVHGSEMNARACVCILVFENLYLRSHSIDLTWKHVKIHWMFGLCITFVFYFCAKHFGCRQRHTNIKWDDECADKEYYHLRHLLRRPPVLASCRSNSIRTNCHRWQREMYQVLSCSTSMRIPFQNCIWRPAYPRFGWSYPAWTPVHAKHVRNMWGKRRKKREKRIKLNRVMIKSSSVSNMRYDLLRDLFTHQSRQSILNTPFLGAIIHRCLTSTFVWPLVVLGALSWPEWRHDRGQTICETRKINI